MVSLPTACDLRVHDVVYFLCTLNGIGLHVKADPRQASADVMGSLKMVPSWSGGCRLTFAICFHPLGTSSPSPYEI